jgi:hypothetical protein
MKQVLDFLKFVAEEKNYKIMKAGSKMGSEITSSLIDDLHNIGKVVSSAKEGAGITILKSIFPKATETAERNIKKINSLEEELFPQLPENGFFYTAYPVRKTVDDEGHGVYCLINSRPQVYFTIHTDRFVDEDLPKSLVVQCIDQEDGAYRIEEKLDSDDVVYTF